MTSLLHLCAATFAGFGPQSVLHAHGLQADRIERLWWLIFAVMVIVFVLVIGSMSLAIWRKRVKVASPAEIEPWWQHEETPREKRLARWVGLCSALTILTLFVLLVFAAATSNSISKLYSKNPITIQVIGHQWWWEVVYPNSQADQTVVTANEIHIPVGMPVVILTSSQDVIHSFWAPQLHGKRDLIPGYQNAIWLQADEPGHYRGQCAEFCGLQHAKMAFSIIAESPSDFQAWLSQQTKPAPDPTDPIAEKGKKVFETHPCVMCHTIRGTDAGSRFGPDLTHVAGREMIAAETLSNTRGNLGGWIIDSQRIKPGNRMPPNNISGDDLDALLTYLQTLR